MEEASTLFGGVLGFVLLAFLCILAILWFILPFIIFGISNRLDGINDKLDKAVGELFNAARMQQKSAQELETIRRILASVHNVDVE